MKGYGIRIAPYAEFLLYRQIVSLNQKQKSTIKNLISCRNCLKYIKTGVKLSLTKCLCTKEEGMFCEKTEKM